MVVKFRQTGRMSSTSSVRSRKRKTPRVWHFPLGVALQYRASMRGYVRTLRANTETMLIPRLADLLVEAYAYRPDAPDGSPMDPLMLTAGAGTWLARLNRSMNDLLTSMDDHGKRLWDIARDYGAKTAEFNAVQFHSMVRRVLAVDVFKAEPWLIPELKAWEIENLRLIRSIPAQHVERLQGTIAQALREGRPTSQVVKAIRDVGGVTEARAELIAEDQIGSLNGQLTRYRQQGIGVTEFKWRGVLDSRERPTHVALEGKVCSWKAPPLGGPGAEIRCRCWAEAIMPALADIDGTVVA